MHPLCFFKHCPDKELIVSGCDPLAVYLHRYTDNWSLCVFQLVGEHSGRPLDFRFARPSCLNHHSPNNPVFTAAALSQDGATGAKVQSLVIKQSFRAVVLSPQTVWWAKMKWQRLRQQVIRPQTTVTVGFPDVAIVESESVTKMQCVYLKLIPI